MTARTVLASKWTITAGFPPDAHQCNMSNHLCNLFKRFSTEAIKAEALLEVQALYKAFIWERLPIHVY